MSHDWQALAAPFDAAAVHWRVGSVSKDKKKCTLLAYLDARDVMDRLDAVVGPPNWRCSYLQGPNGGQICRLEIRVGDEWVWREDGADNTQIEAIKGGLSDALKRAAVGWGIGRYLYRLDASWHAIQDGWAQGGGVNVATKDVRGWVRRPTLPAWARPAVQQTATPTKQDRQQEALPPVASGEYASGADGRRRYMAAISGLGLDHAKVKEYCAGQGWPLPRQVTADRLSRFIAVLEERAGDIMVTP